MYRFTSVVPMRFPVDDNLGYRQCFFAIIDSGAWSTLVHISCALTLVFLRNRVPEMEWLFSMHISVFVRSCQIVL